MGRRRKRVDSDVDESLERGYSRPTTAHHSQRQEETTYDDDDDKKKNHHHHSSSSKEKNPLIPTADYYEQKQNDDGGDKKKKEEEEEEQQKKIERLRLKKKRRKELKQSKNQEKKLKNQQQQDQKKQVVVSVVKNDNKEKADNKNKVFQMLRKGVQYRDVLVGKGREVQDRKKVRVAYTLRAKEQYGKILDTSNDFKFRVGRGEVIQGWDIGVLGMRQGGKRFLKVPPQAGYGQRNVGAGKGGMLFFEITVLDC